MSWCPHSIYYLLSSANKKFVQSRSFLKFLRIFCKLKEQFLRGLKNFAPPPGIRPSFFAPGQRIGQKNCPGGWDSLAQKNFSWGLPGGMMYPVGTDLDTTAEEQLRGRVRG